METDHEIRDDMENMMMQSQNVNASPCTAEKQTTARMQTPSKLSGMKSVTTTATVASEDYGIITLKKRSGEDGPKFDLISETYLFGRYKRSIKILISVVQNNAMCELICRP